MEESNKRSIVTIYAGKFESVCLHRYELVQSFFKIIDPVRWGSSEGWKSFQKFRVFKAHRTLRL